MIRKIEFYYMYSEFTERKNIILNGQPHETYSEDDFDSFVFYCVGIILP